MMDSHQEIKQEVTPRDRDLSMLTLEDTFAFLDSADLKCDTQADCTSSFAPLPISDCRDFSDGATTVQVEDSGDLPGQPRRRRKIVRAVDRPKVSFKRPRKQNRIEILKLHKHVEELESQLLELKQRKQEQQAQELTAVHESMTACGAKACPKVAGTWLGHAAVQYSERQSSETLNRKLKACLDSQVQLKPEVSFCSPPMSSASYRRTEKLYGETDNVVDEIKADNDVSTVFSTSYTKPDVVLGPVYELKSNTPVPESDFHSLSEFFWANLTNSGHNTNVGAAGAALYGADPVKSETDTTELPTRLGDVKVNGVTSVRKFDDPDRVVFTYTSKIKVSGTELVFRENGWLVLSPGNSSQHVYVARKKTAANKLALFQTLYRLHIETRASVGDPGTAADQKYLEELVMDALSNKMRVHQHHLQNLVLKGMMHG
ncbi:hypothetical protein FI667_g11706, partial [Globisporangium splendens]